MTIRTVWDCFLNVFRLRNIHSRLFGSKHPAVLTSSTTSQSCEQKIKQPPMPPSGLRAAMSLLRLDIDTIRPPLVMRASMLKPLNTNGLGLIVQRSLTWSRPLSLIESELLKRSILLPSLIRPLKQGFALFNASRSNDTPSALIMREISTGEIEASGPREFADALDALQSRIIDRIDDLKRLARQLYHMEASVSLAYADGKVSICASSENEMNNVVLPLIKKGLPWNDSFNVNLLVSTPALTPAPIYLHSEAAVESSNSLHSQSYSISSFQSCNISMSSFAEPSLRDILPDAHQDELEVFSAWSEA